MKKTKLISLFVFLFHLFSHEQTLSSKVNPFLGSSGDHGQMSPGASYPFSMMDICPQTYPNGHTGYEYRAKTILGFTHNRFEGVGCQGSGGNILITPFIQHTSNEKKSESASPGFYSVEFTNGIRAKFTVFRKSGVEQYHFPDHPDLLHRRHVSAGLLPAAQDPGKNDALVSSAQNKLLIDLSHTLANPFVREQHQINQTSLSGWIESGTTCGMGIYRVYYYIIFDEPIQITDSSNHLVLIKSNNADLTLRIAFSSESVDNAKSSILLSGFDEAKAKSASDWNMFLGHIKVSGDASEEKLFYSELYRVLQSPYIVSKSSEKTKQQEYNGWSVWDNYKTQLPLLSLAYPDEYRDIISSLASLYTKGKKNWATDHEPSNTVRTEHSIVVLLDAYRKGYPVDFNLILDSLLRETDSLKYNHPDKALESCYDAWAMSEILNIVHKDSLATIYKNKALTWRTYWKKDFADLSKDDVDDLPARGMYQGTIWQYRWFAPFDIKGLIDACGGEEKYIQQLDSFFGNDLYNASNEPDIQVPYLYNGTSQPYKSQSIIHKYARDTVIQYYYNDNSRGIDPFIGRIFNNRPDAYVRTMDDDGGAMSGWYVLAAIGLSPACVGHPIWYLHVPLFREITLNATTKPFKIQVKNFNEKNKYIQSVTLNGKPLDRNWLTQKELTAGGDLIITASEKPNKAFGINNRWISSF